MLRVTKYKERGPSLIRGLDDAGTEETIDREDGWGAEFITKVPHKYTVIQSISRVIEYEPDAQWMHSTDRERFTEMWHSSSSTKILDKFVIPRWYRVGCKGSIRILARAWLVPDHLGFAANGFVEGSIGNEPWADTHGRQGTIPIPPDTVVLERRFLAWWENYGIEDTKTVDSHYWRGRDMNMQHSSRSYVTPPPGGYRAASPEL